MSHRTGFISRPVILAGATVAVLVAAVLFFIMQRRTVATPAEIGVVLKCAKCGEPLHTNAQFVTQSATRFFPDLLAPGLTCTKCGDNAVVQAFECPKDHAVFYAQHLPADLNTRSSPDEATAINRSPILCPTCKWDPLAAQRELMLKP